MTVTPPSLPQLTAEAETEVAANLACRCGARLGMQARRYHLIRREVHPQTLQPITVAMVVLTCGRDACPLDQWARSEAIAFEPNPPLTYLRDRQGPDDGYRPSTSPRGQLDGVILPGRTNGHHQPPETTGGA